jgi:hypothetical protein
MTTNATPPAPRVAVSPQAASRQTPMRSPLSTAQRSLRKIPLALQRLCSMKKTLELTPHQLETWDKTLGCYFPEDIVTRAIIEFGLSADPFPDIGKLIERCSRIKAERSSEYAPGRDYSKPPVKLVDSVLNAFGLTCEGSPYSNRKELKA